MKVIWESDDVFIGRRVKAKGCSETWTVGYLSDMFKFALISDQNHIIKGVNFSKEMAAHLTEYHYLPAELS